MPSDRCSQGRHRLRDTRRREERGQSPALRLHMGDGAALGHCPCLSSLWARLRGGEETTEDRPIDVVMSPIPASLYRPPQTDALYVAVRDFVAGQEDEISFQKGDRFKVLGRGGEWWTVQKVDGNGQTRSAGNVPYNYLERVESLETQPWFFGTLTRSEAEDLLMSSENSTGAFLIRRSENENMGYVLSVKSWTPVRHFKVLQDEEKKFHFESSQHFSSLEELVDHFSDCAFEGIGKLREPCTKEKPEVPQKMKEVSELEFSVPLEEESLYVALWDFDARQEQGQGQGQEEVSFQRGDRFKVLGRSEEWWKVQKIDPNGKVLSSGIVPFNYLIESESLKTEPWFHGTLTRSEAESILMSQNQIGAFLIRRSDKNSVGFVFSVNSQVNHFRIQKNRENNYHLQQMPHFSSLSDLVQHYGLHSVGSMGKLTEPCKKRRENAT